MNDYTFHSHNTHYGLIVNPFKYCKGEAKIAINHLPLLSTIAAAVYGYASTAALCLLSGVALGELAAVFKATAMTVVSMIVGNIFGYVSKRGAGALAKG